MTRQGAPIPDDVDTTRRQLAAEADAARELAGRTRFATPEPIALGKPGADYPLPWSVQTWVPGVVATDDPGTSVAFAHDLAEFIRDVRAIDTCGRTFRGGGRGGDLRAHDAWLATCFRHSEALLDVPHLGCGDLEWERGKACAFQQAMGAVWYYVESNPAMSRMSRRTLERILANTPTT